MLAAKPPKTETLVVKPPKSPKDARGEAAMRLEEARGETAKSEKCCGEAAERLKVRAAELRSR
jgi:hypothetical protein